jgi:hypothetical protein
MSNKKIAKLNIKLKDLFFRWLDITKTFHKLNKQQQQVLALLLYYHYLYKKEITNDKILWKVVFDYDTRVKIREDSIFGEKGLSSNSFENILSTLRKKKVIIDNKINPSYIPDLSSNSKEFNILFIFNIIDND